MDGTRWLDADEEAAWRSLLEGATRLFERLDHELRDGCGMSLDDYEVLVHLSEAPARRLRMNELADVLLHSRSRLTYRVDRLEAAGLVRRERCEDDRRGLFAVLTDEGADALEAAAPTHVEGVRAHLVDRLGPDRLAAVGEALGEVADALRPR